MEQVNMLYRCQRCGDPFHMPTPLTPQQAEDILSNYLYGTDPSSAELICRMEVHEKHECIPIEELKLMNTQDTKRIGIGKLIGYTVVEHPDSDQNENPGPKLSVVKS